MIKKYIYIYGVTSSDNIGDNVICSTFTSIIKEQNPDSKIELRNIFYYPLIWKCVFMLMRVIGKESRKLKRWVNEKFLFTRIPEKSYIIFAGGQLFYEYFIEPVSEIVRIAELKNIEVNFYGCGTGKMTDEKRSTLSHILQSKVIKNIFLRDDYIGLCKELPKIKIVPDVAVCCDRLVNRCRSNKGNTVGIGVIAIQNFNKQNVVKITEEQYVTYISNIISSVINNGYNVEIFCNGNISDYEFARTIYSGYETDQNVQLATRPVTSMDLISLVSRFDYTIASRLHALIISYAFGIPFYGLSWDLKIPSFCSMIGNQNNYLDLHELNVSKVMNVFTTKYNEVLRLELKEVIIKEIKRITE